MDTRFTALVSRPCFVVVVSEIWQTMSKEGGISHPFFLPTGREKREKEKKQINTIKHQKGAWGAPPYKPKHGTSILFVACFGYFFCAAFSNQKKGQNNAPADKKGLTN